MDLNQILIEAAKDGNMFVLKAALEKGADIDAKDNSGMTALMYAQQKGYAEIVNFLKEKGAKEEETVPGSVYSKSGEHPKSIEAYAKAIELDPQGTYAYYNRGNTYRKIGKYQEAINDYYQEGILYLKQNNKARDMECISSMKEIDSSSQLINKLQDLIEQI